ncbi:MAG: hypothetical protein KAH21_13270, partial [Spirochaetaceae bacterium]|nr:hypothetical protein [Spirochaetaceae bacterium]
SIPELISSLDRIAENDSEKTRALYIWVTHNIAYDTDSYFQGIPGAVDSTGTFNTRSSVCEGYASLFEEIGRGLGLELVKVHGYAKGYGYKEGYDPGGTNHAWNAVRIDGEWQLFDSTWGAGYVDGRDFHRKYKEFYYNTPPDEFVFSHYPSDTALQFTTDTVSRELFFELPKLDGDEFSLGIDAIAVRAVIESGKEFGMPTIYSSDFPVTLTEFPMISVLKADRTYRIVIETEAPFALISYGNDEKKTIANKRGRFVIQEKFPKGNMGIFLAPLDAQDMYSHSYEGFLSYPVE